MKLDRDIDRINDIFYRLAEDVSQLYDGAFNVRLVLDQRDRYPDARSFAMSSANTVYVSPKLLGADAARIEGLLMHELAHVYMLKLGINSHTELQTDELAEVIFDKRIYYDKDDVQTTRPGKHPRPSYLPNN